VLRCYGSSAFLAYTGDILGYKNAFPFVFPIFCAMGGTKCTCSDSRISSFMGLFESREDFFCFGEKFFLHV
jgi:Sec-independent protein secretion pathway component TatC